MQETRPHRWRHIWVGMFALGFLAMGCTRPMYRRQADREAYYLVREKSAGTPWEVPKNYTVQPDPRSRFFDPTDPDHPILPPAGPFLYQYQLPQLHGPRSPEPLPPASGQPMPLAPAPGTPAPAAPARSGSAGAPPTAPPGLPPAAALPDPPSASAHPSIVPPAARGPMPPSAMPMPGPANGAANRPVYGPAQGGNWVRPVAYLQTAQPLPAPAAAAAEDPFADVIDVSSGRTGGRPQVGNELLQIPAVGPEYWEKVPASCLARMLEFESVRSEYKDSYKKPPSPDMLDSAPRLSLHDIFRLALINSREYQLQKENLYRAALDVSLERYDYATKFTTSGNSVDTTYTHNRAAGTTVNSLLVPSSLQGNKLLATGGTLVGRFANDVVLRFNGPEGFSSVVNSDLFFSITQSVFQRDIVLNSLIQSERDLVYAARRFARFRKQFFLDIAVEYYTLLRSYRSIEIDAQNYFAQVRNFQQAEEEVRSEITTAPNPIAVNQFEQGVLSGRSSLIRACNDLEQALDNLKITMGIPTETPINVDLTELQQLTLRDDIEVEKERAHRWQKRLLEYRSRANAADLTDILNADASLAERLYTWMMMSSQLSGQPVDVQQLAELRAQFRLDIARLDAVEKQAALKEATNPKPGEPPAPPIFILQRQLDLIISQEELVQRQGQFAVRRNFPAHALDPLRQQYTELRKRFDDLRAAVEAGLKTPRQLVEPGNEAKDKVRVQDLLDKSSQLLAELTTLSQNLDRLIFGHQIDRVDTKETVARTDWLLQHTETMFANDQSGLPPVDISVDDAMVTALVQRLDLMNQRGTLADNWRQIKIAADELKSVLNLNAAQTLRTHDNRPFDFSFRDSETRLGLSFDLPLNRKAQRNSYRRALLSYNRSQRDLMAFEDNIKLRIRREVRNLEQARVQYPIAVTQAALAKEQVFSVQMQVILGLAGAGALDLLKAFSDSREALGRVADARIGYIIERANFAFELEAIMLDDEGFWPQINDNKYRFQPNTVYPWNAGSAYGDFPSYLKVSHELKRMLNYAPPGVSKPVRWNRFQTRQ